MEFLRTLKTPTRRKVMAQFAASVSGLALSSVWTFHVIERDRWILRVDDIDDS